MLSEETEGLVSSLNNGTVIIEGTDDNINCGFYLDRTQDGVLQKGQIVVCKGSDVSGTVKVGTYQSGVFITLAELKLNKANNLKIGVFGTFQSNIGGYGGVSEVLFTVNSDYDGNIVFSQSVELTNGILLVGNYGTPYTFDGGLGGSYSGIIVAGETKVESINTSGLVVSMENNKPSVSGYVNGSHYFLEYANGPSPRLMVVGETTIKYPDTMMLKNNALTNVFNNDYGTLSFADVDVTIAEKSKLIIGTESKIVGDRISIETLLPTEQAILVTEEMVIFGTVNPSKKEVTFSGVEYDKEYNILLVQEPSSGCSDYSWGTIQFLKGPIKNTAEVYFKDAGTLNHADSQRIYHGYSNITKKVTMSYSTFLIEYALLFSNEIYAIGQSYDGRISFDSGLLTTESKILLFLKNSEQGPISHIFFGSMLLDGSGAVDGMGVNVLKDQAPLYSVISTENLTYSDNKQEYNLHFSTHYRWSSALQVEGTIEVMLNDVCISTISASSPLGITLNDRTTGMIKYYAYANAEMPLNTGWITINAAYCEVTPESKNIVIHYFSSLKEILSLSSTAYIIGTYYIGGDISLSNGSSKVEINLSAGSALLIGTGSQNVTVIQPVETVINVSGHGRYEVLSGTVIKRNSAGNDPLSDVSYGKSGEMIFKDIHTALGDSIEGETIYLSRKQPDLVIIQKSCAIKEGVTLQLNNNNLSISNYVTLTVEGAIVSGSKDSSAFSMGIGSKLVVANNGKIEFGGPYASLSRVDIHEGGLVKVVAFVEGEPISGAEYYVAGSLELLNGAISKNMIIEGTVSSKNAIIIENKLIIGTAPSLLSDLTNSANVSDATFYLESGAVAIVYGKSAVSNNNFNGDIVCTEFKSEKETYAKEYANTRSGFALMEELHPELKDYEFRGWYSDSFFASPFTFKQDHKVGEPEVLYGHFLPRKINITLYYNPSIDWTYNGILIGDSGIITVNYGDKVSINAYCVENSKGFPIIVVDNMLYIAGTEYAVTEPSVFRAIGVSRSNEEASSEEYSLEEMLLVGVILILSFMLAITMKKLLQ
ncbi:MAG: hypothetical protein FWG96_07280 [Methanomassiliicoccaceae archaeon]|nr:hypothetical protein [Methanomassiliicoccaceae archaeon]